MDTGTDTQTSVTTAMSEVLGAEREALDRLAECERRADAVVADARQAVRALVRRTRQRIARLHAGCTRKNEQLIMRLERDAAAQDAARTPADDVANLLQLAVDDVARELTTGERSGAD